jgi:hypothetical protein
MPTKATKAQITPGNGTAKDHFRGFTCSYMLYMHWMPYMYWMLYMHWMPYMH